MTAQQKSAARRLRRMYDLLLSTYGPQLWWPAQSRFEIIIGAYLTQNTAWASVERSLNQLRNAGVLSIDGLRQMPLDALQVLIRPSGFATRKGPALKAFIALLDADFGGSLDEIAAGSTETVRASLLALPGVGPETADAILLYALGHTVPVADEYLRRIAERHRLVVPASSRKRVRYDMLTELTRGAFAEDPKPVHGQLYNEFHALTVAVGKAHCSRIPDCAFCPLASDPHEFSARKGGNGPQSLQNK